MNKKEMKSEEHRKLYRIPGGANYQLRSKNAIYISPGNSIKHELAKCIGAYMIRKWSDIKITDSVLRLLDALSSEIDFTMRYFDKDKSDFITEAVPKGDPKRRVDLVRLDDNTRYEFESSKRVKKDNCITIYL